MGEQSLELSAITEDHIDRVAAYLSRELNERVSAAAWVAAMQPPWQGQAVNHGFLLAADGEVVGACLAIYSERVIAGRVERFCNLGALCVDEEYRSHAFRLIRAVLAQPGYHFTDLSPSGNVVALNERLGFVHLDTTTALVPTVPHLRRRRGVSIVSDHAEIDRTLRGEDLRVFRDHRDAAAARHLLIRDGADHCHVIFRRDRRKGLPLFASILHVSDPRVFARTSSAVASHLLLRHGVAAMLAELRVVGERPRRSTLLASPRRKMFRSRTLGAQNIDYLYSELTCVAW